MHDLVGSGAQIPSDACSPRKTGLSGIEKRAIGHAHAYNAQKIYVEDTGVGIGLIGEMKSAGLRVIAVRPERDKKTRISIQSAKIESGMVLLPKQASWLAGYEAEMLCLPARYL